MKRYGFSIFEVLLIVAILGIILAIALPNFTASTARVRRDTCISNLRQIDLAKEQWALENNKDVGDEPTAAQLDSYLREDIWDSGYTTGHTLICPLDESSTPTFDTSYDIEPIGTNPECNHADSPSDHSL